MKTRSPIDSRPGWLVCAVSLLLLASCDSRGSAVDGWPVDAGGGRTDTGADSNAPNYPLKCQTLLRTLCEKLISCGSPLTVSECVAGFTKTDCSRAIGVSSTFDQCLRDIPAGACPPEGGQLPLPDSCVQVLEFP